jgi:hypothetical protein
MKKGINFKQSGKKKLLLIQPETLSAYLDSLPKGANGWIAFDFLELAEPDKLGHFAKCLPLPAKP